LFVLTLWDTRRGKTIPGFQDGKWVWLAILAHVVLALVYTTPWDNYLIATGVWYYAPKLVSGVIFGYVPLEEYTFFVLETLLAGLTWWLLARRLPASSDEFAPSRELRLTTFIGLLLVWLLSLVILFSGWQPGEYLSITLAWALPAIAPQIIVGADILWHYRKLVALNILSMTLYLSVVDAFAIASGSWTINAARSTGIFIGALPIEEALFFLVTAALVTFGVTLLLSDMTRQRFTVWRESMRGNTARV